MGLRQQFINNYVFSTLACAAGFNYNDHKQRNLPLKSDLFLEDQDRREMPHALPAD